ncbi:MAG: hypothetical protein KJ955_03350 [Nanoarchaeota archaeon]|nr:hypothetical protein [Nanoarchaeota archaeon]
MKKGQVTIFVILSVLIIASAAIYLVYTRLPAGKTASREVSALLPEFAESGNMIEDCLGNVLKAGVEELGLQGGYMDNSGLKKYDYAGLDVTYLYYDEKSYLPTTDEMAASLEDYMEANAPQCQSVVKNVDFTAGNIKDVNVYIRETSVDAEIEWPITFRKGELTSRVDLFRASKLFRLGAIMNELTGFMTVQVENPDEVCLSCLIDAGERNSFVIDIDNMITTYVFDIKDASASGETFDFVFAHGY